MSPSIFGRFPLLLFLSLYSAIPRGRFLDFSAQMLVHNEVEKPIETFICSSLAISFAIEGILSQICFTSAPSSNLTEQIFEQIKRRREEEDVTCCEECVLRDRRSDRRLWLSFELLRESKRDESDYKRRETLASIGTEQKARLL